MIRGYAGRLFFTILFALLMAAGAIAQTITTGAVDPGPYGQGSSLAVLQAPWE